jgi:serine/threonine protein kinase
MRLLGMGGFGIVTMVYSHEVEEFFALKTIRAELLTDMDARTQFIQEANLWVNLGHHSNIIKAEFVDNINDEIVILMELIEPNQQELSSLQDHINNRKKIPLDEIIRLTVGICNGMMHAYSTGIKSHRDLKPDNIMVSNDGTAKVTDFGLSSLANSVLFTSNVAGKKIEVNQTLGNTIMGTLPYMPPEQFINARNCDEHSDIYSFGIILYQLISKGRWPYGDITSIMKDIPEKYIPNRFFELHSNGKPKFLFHKLFKVAKACLNKEPSERPASFYYVKRLLLDAYPVDIDEETTENESSQSFWELARKAKSLQRLGRYEDALQLFEDAQKIFPFDTQVMFDIALTLSKLDRDAEAFELYKKLIKKEPSHLGALVNIGLLYQKAGDLGLASHFYTSALEHHPDDTSVLVNLGNIAYKQNNYDIASQYYRKAVDIDTNYPTGWYNLGLSLKALGFDDKANNCFSNFLQSSDPLDSRRDYVLNVLNQKQ